MADLKELLTLEDLDEVWEASRKQPILLFKQSTTCPISAEAFGQFNQFLEETATQAQAYFVKVRETRQVSDEIEEELGIGHESPQIFIVKNRQAVWHTSHAAITKENIDRALAANK